jgi:hypothetical protein
VGFLFAPPHVNDQGGDDADTFKGAENSRLFEGFNKDVAPGGILSEGVFQVEDGGNDDEDGK